MFFRINICTDAGAGVEGREKVPLIPLFWALFQGAKKEELKFLHPSNRDHYVSDNPMKKLFHSKNVKL